MYASVQKLASIFSSKDFQFQLRYWQIMFNTVCVCVFFSAIILRKTLKIISNTDHTLIEPDLSFWMALSSKYRNITSCTLAERRQVKLDFERDK